MFRDYHAIAILGVPHVVVRQAVDVHVPAVIVPVHVRNEDSRALNHQAHHQPNHDRLNFMWDLEVR